MKTRFLIILLAICASGYINAQIGYQVSLLNSATGEPRANETVSVTVEITNADGTSIIQQTQSATTNDFGVLSLAVGNSDSFANVDWSKQPFYVSATVDGIMIGKSQILNVPFAEAAKTLVPAFSLDELVGTYRYIEEYDGGSYVCTLSLNKDFTFSMEEESWMCTGFFFISGNILYFNMPQDEDDNFCLLFYNGKFYSLGEEGYYFCKTINSGKK